MLKALIIVGLIATLPSTAADLHPAKLVGDYNGGQMEMAAGLSLKASGRFEYGLSYGALDEGAGGIWAASDREVLLTSDKVIPPLFSLAGQNPAAPGTLLVTLALPGRI